MHVKVDSLLTAIRSTRVLGLTALYAAFAAIIIYFLSNNVQVNSTNTRPMTPNAAVVISENALNKISTWHLFGFNKNVLLRKVSDSNIELVGIIFDGKNSKAIMMVNSKEFVFKNGDIIDHQYTIKKIETSRIIVGTKEGLEEMDLFGKKHDEREEKPKSENYRSMPQFIRQK